MAVPYTAQQAALCSLTYWSTIKGRGKRDIGRATEEDPSHQDPCSHLDNRGIISGDPETAKIACRVPRLVAPQLSMAPLKWPPLSAQFAELTSCVRICISFVYRRYISRLDRTCPHCSAAGSTSRPAYRDSHSYFLIPR